MRNDRERAKAVQCALEYTTLRKVTQATEIFYDPDPTVPSLPSSKHGQPVVAWAGPVCCFSGYTQAMLGLCNASVILDPWSGVGSQGAAKLMTLGVHVQQGQQLRQHHVHGHALLALPSGALAPHASWRAGVFRS